MQRDAVLITGGSRGVGAATARAFGGAGFDVAFTYRNKSARAERVAEEIELMGVRALAVRCDVTREADLDSLFQRLGQWCDSLRVVVLNASGGMEADLVAADADYPFRINRDAQVALVERTLTRMRTGGTIVFVTSHWAHLHGQVPQLPGYAPVAASKRAGEDALRALQDAMARRGVRLLVVTGDMIQDSITVRPMERATPGLVDARRNELGALPSAADLAHAILAASRDETLPSGHTVVVGGSLDALLSRTAPTHRA